MDPRSISADVIALNYIGFSGFELTDPASQRIYAFEFSDKAGNFVYLDNDKQLKIVVDPRKCPAGTKIAGMIGYQTKSTAYRKFPPNSSATNEGTAFDLSLDKIDQLLSAYRRVL